MQFRIGDRDPVTGLYDVIYPDGSHTRNGIKIFNSAHEFGDVVLASRRSDGMLILDSVKSALLPSSLGLGGFNDKPVGYLSGQVFNGEDEQKRDTGDLITVLAVPQTNFDGQLPSFPYAYASNIDRSIAGFEVSEFFGGNSDKVDVDGQDQDFLLETSVLFDSDPTHIQIWGRQISYQRAKAVSSQFNRRFLVLVSGQDRTNSLNDSDGQINAFYQNNDPIEWVSVQICREKLSRNNPFDLARYSEPYGLLNAVRKMGYIDSRWLFEYFQGAANLKQYVFAIQIDTYNPIDIKILTPIADPIFPLLQTRPQLITYA
jgi:hypothetical protein